MSPSKRAPHPLGPIAAGYIVRFSAGVQPAHIALHARLLSLLCGFTMQHLFTDVLQGFSVCGRLSTRALLLLANSRVVASVEPDLYVFSSIGTFTPVADLLSCDRAHLFILDTGVSGCPALNVTESRSFVPGEPSVADLNGHGSACAEGVAGSGLASAGVALSLGTDLSVPKSVPIHSLKVLDRHGTGTLSNAVAALDAVARFRKLHPSPAVFACLNLSGFAGSAAYNALDSAIQAASLLYGIRVHVTDAHDGMDPAMFTPTHSQEAVVMSAPLQPPCADVAQVVASVCAALEPDPRIPFKPCCSQLEPHVPGLSFDLDGNTLLSLLSSGKLRIGARF